MQELFELPIEAYPGGDVHGAEVAEWLVHNRHITLNKTKASCSLPSVLRNIYLDSEFSSSSVNLQVESGPVSSA